MNSLSSAHFQLLKIEVLQNAGIKTITPADCKAISLQISNFTKQVISETTLKRIFGFALSKFNPSQYTIDLMAKYCGYSGWKDFCEKQDIGKIELPNENMDWNNLRNEAMKITEFTLHALKNRSGIPFNQTVERKFFENHMHDFIASDSMGTVFAAPTGYGKSIALCHWVEQQLQLNYAKYSDDIILFFSSHALMSALHSGKDLANWLLALLGYSTETGIKALASLTQKKDYKFYLIIDGFDPHLLKNDQFNILISQLGDIFSLRKSCDFFKVVLTMRTSTWVNHKHEWEDEKYSWFNSLNADNQFINMPMFAMKEIGELRYKINPVDNSAITLKTAQTVSNPLYFQYYYKQHKANFSLKHIDNMSVYDILSVFVTNKIYTSLNSADKMAFIMRIIEEMDFANDNYNVDKLKLTTLLKQNACIYQDFLSMGVLKEINSSDNYRYENYIRFSDPNILDHFIAKTLLYESNNQFDYALVHKVNTLLTTSSHKLSVLKWCIIGVVKSGDMHNLEYLTQVDVTTTEKAELITFMGDLLKREVVNTENNKALLKYFKEDKSEKLFDYFFGLELINNDYKTALLTLLKFDLTIKQKITVNTSLAIIAVIQLDMNELEHAINQMNKLPADEYYAFPIDPLSCLDAIFHFFKFGFIKKDALADLTKASFALSEQRDTQIQKCAVNDTLFLLATYTLWLCDNPKKVLRFTNIVKKAYDTDGIENTQSPYNFFTSLLKADAHFKAGDKSKVKYFYDSVSQAYDKTEGILTPFMKALFFSLKIKLFINKHKDNSILHELKCVNTVAEDSGNKFSRVYILMLLLKDAAFLLENPSFKKQAGHDYNMILTKSGIDRDRFQI